MNVDFKLLLWCFVSFTAFIIYFYLGFYVIRLNPSGRLNIVFFGFCLVLGIWSFAFSFYHASPDVTIASFWFKIAAIGFCSFSGFVCHFFIIISGKEKMFGRWWIWLFLYIPEILLVYNSFAGQVMAKGFEKRGLFWYHVVPDNSFWYWLNVIITVVYVLGGLYFVYCWFSDAQSPKEKKQAMIIFTTGGLTLLFGSITNITMPHFNIMIIPALAHIFIMTFAIGIWYVIKKYGLMTFTPQIAVEKILSRVLDMIILTNRDGRIIKANRRVEEVLGYNESELVGKEISFLFDDQNKHKYLMQIDIEKYAVHEIKYNAKDGEIIPVNVSISDVYDDYDYLLGTVYISQDIRQTYQLQVEIEERMKIADELIKSNEKLKELDKLKSDFLSTVSHELRTPLTSVLGFAKLIGMKLDSIVFPRVDINDIKTQRSIQQIKGNLDIIISEGKRLTDLINEVLDLAKMEEGKIEWNMKLQSIPGIIEQSAMSLASLFEQKDLDLVINMQPGIPDIYCDRDRIIQVLVNLLSNAVKFTPKGEIVCSVEKNDSYVVVSVKDEGIGIAEENLERIFEKFKQIGDALTQRPLGTGLGLPICKQIIEYHNGRIWAESQQGEGSTFYFTLPVQQDFNHEKTDTDPLLSDADENLVQDEETWESVSFKTRASRKILVVDDESQIRKLLKEYLEEEGYIVCEIADGEFAVEAVKREMPDLVILDVLMPKINGFDIARTLKSDELTCNIPIFILSIMDEREKGKAVGVERYFVKSSNFENLMEDIRMLFEN